MNLRSAMKKPFFRLWKSILSIDFLKTIKTIFVIVFVAIWMLFPIGYISWDYNIRVNEYFLMINHSYPEMSCIGIIFGLCWFTYWFNVVLNWDRKTF